MQSGSKSVSDAMSVSFPMSRSFVVRVPCDSSNCPDIDKAKVDARSSLAPSGITEIVPTVRLRHSSASGQGGCGTFQISS